MVFQIATKNVKDLGDATGSATSVTMELGRVSI